MHTDIESLNTKHSKSLKRRWNSLPRFVKLYVSIGILLLLLLTVILVLQNYGEFKNNTNSGDSNQSKHLNDNNERTESDSEMMHFTDDRTNDADKNERINVKEEIKPYEFNSDLKGDGTLSAELFQRSAVEYQSKEQKAIVTAMKHSWDAYRTYAWGADHLRPITKTRHEWFNVGLTILDSIDTLIIMGLTKEYNDALNWLKTDLQFDIHRDVNCFEMTIRALGGLLSAYHLTKESAFLIKASDLGERLIHCFDTPMQLVPFSDVNLKTKVPKTPSWSPDSSLSEVSSVQLEFRDLTYLTGIAKYEKLSFRTSQHIHNLTVQSGNSLLPMYINPHTGRLSRATITLGARGDSYYEYLLKQYVQTGIRWLKDDYIKAMSEMKNRILKTTNGPLKLTYIGEILRSSNVIHPKMDHLTCFLSGTLSLGYYHEIMKSPKIREHTFNDRDDDTFRDHMIIAEKLARTCYMMYNTTGTGLSPEIAYFGEGKGEDELQIRPADAHNLLRPEFVESLFYLYHITGKQIYRDWGWNVFKAFEKYTKVSSGGYTSINDVRNPSNVRPKDMQESFWLGETLKYLYLLFCDDKLIINTILDNYVINTEAHLFPRRVKS